MLCLGFEPLAKEWQEQTATLVSDNFCGLKSEKFQDTKGKKELTTFSV